MKCAEDLDLKCILDIVLRLSLVPFHSVPHVARSSRNASTNHLRAPTIRGEGYLSTCYF